ncbi:hypothetical protein C1645_738023 [Glomus cerebriforme]|uniref:Uncharacterized protein n=1 Tax=Glomus cerebriforme TaxID=658196 RepID=A0A397SZY5_9GLOM|nr:hypothetical protein C1645_738023 [Glomus cerebriforme]
MTRKRNQVLFNKEVYTPRNNYRREDDDINEDIETNYARSTGSIDMAELIELFQSKTKKRSSSRFDKFEHEQGDRIEKAREMIDGESGIITIWATEMEKITSNVKRKTDDRLERENEYIKKLKFEFEKYQSVTTKTLDNLTKLHSQSQKLGRDIDNNLRQLYETDETELNEALEQFIKQQNYVHKILLHTNKCSFNSYKVICCFFEDFAEKQTVKTNNHAIFYVAQLATYLEFSRTAEARNLIETFANTTFQNMILSQWKTIKFMGS